MQVSCTLYSGVISLMCRGGWLGPVVLRLGVLCPVVLRMWVLCPVVLRLGVLCSCGWGVVAVCPVSCALAAVILIVLGPCGGGSYTCAMGCVLASWPPLLVWDFILCIRLPPRCNKKRNIYYCFHKYYTLCIYTPLFFIYFIYLFWLKCNSNCNSREEA